MGDCETEYWRVDANHSCWKREAPDTSHLDGREIHWLSCPKCGRDIANYRITAEEFEAGRKTQ